MRLALARLEIIVHPGQIQILNVDITIDFVTLIYLSMERFNDASLLLDLRQAFS